MKKHMGLNRGVRELHLAGVAACVLAFDPWVRGRLWGTFPRVLPPISVGRQRWDQVSRAPPLRWRRSLRQKLHLKRHGLVRSRRRPTRAHPRTHIQCAAGTAPLHLAKELKVKSCDLRRARVERTVQLVELP